MLFDCPDNENNKEQLEVGPSPCFDAIRSVVSANHPEAGLKRGVCRPARVQHKWMVLLYHIWPHE